MDNSNSAVESSTLETSNKGDNRVEGQKVDAADPGYGFILDDQIKEELAKSTQHFIRPESHIPNLLGSPEKKEGEQKSESVSSETKFEEPSGPEKVGESTQAERAGESRNQEKAGEGGVTEEKADMNGEKSADEEKSERQRESRDDNTVDMEQAKQGGWDDSFADVLKQESKPEDAHEPSREEREDFKTQEEEEPMFEETNEPPFEAKKEPETQAEPKPAPPREEIKSVQPAEKTEEVSAQPREEEKHVQPAEQKEAASAPPAEQVTEEARPYDFLQATPSERPVETGPPILSQVMEALKSEDKSPVQSPASWQTPSSAEGKTSKEESSTKARGTGTQYRHYFDLVADLLYWRDPRKSGAALGTILVVLLSLKFLSLISVVSYSALAALAITLSFRIYKNVMQAVQKTQDGHPFKEYLEMDVTVPSEKVHETADVLAARLNSVVLELRRLFLVEDLFDSLKFGLALWLLTYVGAWFNGLTLVILAVVGLFTFPKVYETHQDKIDQNLDMIRGRINEITEKVQAVLPIGKKPKSQ